MPRPQKCRRICSMPGHTAFGPLTQESILTDPIDLTLDEYECIRLMDLEGCTQEECALQMGVARTTIQAVYTSARKKLADAIVNGKSLEIRGGNYQVCGHGKTCCRRPADGSPCQRRRCTSSS
ncbi:MAG: DUF134 domain-containing protein [Lachnospiraceae bacterium]|nr:DUF134 domain-containing protein [Lachnospiraceae bacterium]